MNLESFTFWNVTISFLKIHDILFFLDAPVYL